MKMMHNVRDVRGNNFFALGVVWQQPFFLGQRSKCMGWGGVMVDPSWDVAKRAWTILSVFLNKCLCLLPIYIQKIIRKIVFFPSEKLKKLPKAFCLPRKFAAILQFALKLLSFWGRAGQKGCWEEAKTKNDHGKGNNMAKGTCVTWCLLHLEPERRPRRWGRGGGECLPTSSCDTTVR